eukprot:g42302.t1
MSHFYWNFFQHSSAFVTSFPGVVVPEWGVEPQELVLVVSAQFPITFESALHSSLKHLDHRDTYIRFLLIDYSSTFNTIIPSSLISKLHDLDLHSARCNWILCHLWIRKPPVRIGGSIRTLTNFYRCTIESTVRVHNSLVRQLLCPGPCFVTMLGDISRASDEAMLFNSAWNLYCPVRY